MVLPATRRVLAQLASAAAKECRHQASTLEQLLAKPRRGYFSGNLRRDGLEELPRDATRQVRREAACAGWRA